MAIVFFVQFVLGFLLLGQEIQADADVRLINGTTKKEGFVQIKYNGSWTMVDYDLEKQYGLDYVICGMLNYPKAAKGYSQYSKVYTNTSRYPYRLFCKGWETNIGECQTSLITDDRPYRYKGSLYVMCDNLSKEDNETQFRLEGTGSKSSGIVEMRRGGVWKRLCYPSYKDKWDFGAANVMCKMIGFPRAVGYFFYKIQDIADFRKHNFSQLSKYYRCNGTEDNVAECANVGYQHSCEWNHFPTSLYLGLFCQEGEVPPPVQFRLTRGDNANDGNLEMRYRGAWGTICSELKKSTKEIICRELGWLGWRGFEGESYPVSDSFASWEFATTCDDPRNLTCSYFRPYKVGPCGSYYYRHNYQTLICKVALAARFKVVSGCFPQLTIDRTVLSEKEKQLISFYQVTISGGKRGWYKLYIPVNMSSLSLGDGQMYGRIKNTPLEIGEEYEIDLRGVYKGKDGKLGFGVKSEQKFVHTGCPTTKAPSTIAVVTIAAIAGSESAPPPSNSLSSGTIVVICVVAILFIAVVALVVYAFRTRERNGERIPDTEPLEA